MKHHLLRRLSRAPGAYSPTYCSKRMPWDRPGVHLNWKSFMRVEKADRCVQCESRMFRGS